MATEILRGADVPINLMIKDTDGNAIDIDSLTGLIIILYYSDNEEVLSKYSREVKGGYRDIDVIDAATGVVQIKLQSTTTKLKRPGKILAEVKTQAAVGVGYGDGKFHTATRHVEIAQLVNALSKDIDSLEAD